MFVGTSASVARFVTTSAVNSAMVWFVWFGSEGALFTSVTTTVKLLVALKGGTPLSVTMVVIVFVLGPCASVGVQLMTPLVSIVAPAGGFTKTYVRLLVGTSGSLARLVTVSALNSAIVRFVCSGSTGGRFASFTTTLKLFV